MLPQRRHCEVSGISIWFCYRCVFLLHDGPRYGAHLLAHDDGPLDQSAF
jgi:hypothetical protein